MAIHAILGRMMLTLVVSFILWGLSEWAREMFASKGGRFNLIEPFLSFGPDLQIGAWMIPLIALGIGCVIRLLFWHHRAWVGALTLFVCSAFLSSIEYTFGWTIDTIAFFGGFESPIDQQSTHEMILRGKFFMMLWVFVLIGLLFGALFGRSFIKNDARRFRKIRKRLLKRRAYGS